MIKDFDFHTNNQQIQNTFKLKELNIVIKKILKKSVSGADNIHNLLIKNSTQGFRKMILHLINLTIEQSNLPHKWKNSIKSMIPKKQQNKNSSNPKDYRPISLTSCLAKIAERLMLTKIKDLTDSKILSSSSNEALGKNDKPKIIFFS